MKLASSINTISGLQIFQVVRFTGIFLTGVLLTKAGIDATLIGNYEKLILIAGACSFFWVQGILNGMLAGYENHSERRAYLFNVFILLSSFSVIIYGLMQLFSIQLQLFVSNGTLPGYRLICLYILFNSPCFLIETIYLLQKKTQCLILYGAVSAIVSLAAVVLPLMMGYTIESAIALLVLWSIIRLFWLLRMIITLSTPDFKFNLIKGHLLIAWPLILSYLIGGSTDYIDGVMATHFFGPTTFAVFRFGAREFPISLLLANALSISLIPLLGGSSTMQSGLGLVKMHSSRLLHVIFPLSILLIFTSKWFYPLVFDHRFADSAAIFNIYLLLAISRMVFPQSIALALKENRALLIISLVEIIINIIASYLLMMKFGIIGIAWGTVIAYSSEKLMLSAYLSFKYQLRLADYVPLLTWLSYSVLLLISYIFTTYI